MVKPFEVSDGDFEEKVLKSSKPVLVDFWAPWCVPCKMVGPIVDELAGEYDGKVTFAKMDVDKSPKTASSYFVMSIPTLIIFKDGKPITNLTGFKPKEQIKEELDEVLE